ncbi:MAG: PRC-barrel domain-containing protein [Candidatus Bathyarchaeota archaeon]|nr:PRC-barrel domain-containing protein [Candidatus Bathyarchaeota archaeon]
MVSADELSGKKIVSLKGDEIGEVRDVEVDPLKWQVTHLQMKLSSRAAVSLGFKKTIGSYTVCMPIELVSSIGDVVTINKTLLDIAATTDIKECPTKSVRRRINVSL